MKYDRFENLPVWNAAMDLVDAIYKLTRDRAFSQPGDLRDQLRRAALSVSNNIAEGFERGTTPELLQFIHNASGSAGEVRSMLCVCNRLQDFSHLKSEISNFKSISESCSRQLRGWADNLKNTDIKGRRHLNDQSRNAYDRHQRSSAFWNELEEQHRRRVEDWSHRMQSQEPPGVAKEA